ncbi:MAG TPA: hypothetical protein VKD90_06395 [Gemmataceae bacterium]|nr:hypothetical protein [Gemmataceae bacterium]
MPRALLLLALLALPAQAAPQLKPKPAAPEPEDGRIQALKDKYENLLHTASLAERNAIAFSRQFVKQMIEYVEGAKSRGDPELIAASETALLDVLGKDPVRWDFYDIHTYDCARKNSAGGK